MKERLPNLSQLTQQFWDSLKGYQRDLISLTVNHQPYIPSNKNWKQLNNHQKHAVIQRLWMCIKQQTNREVKE